MNNQINRIISASAGTGKTYRLSLEYLALLLKFSTNPDFKPDQILVITFTKKATAEIRERIYLHLDILGHQKHGWEQLAINLKRLTAEVDASHASHPEPVLEKSGEGLKIPAFAGMTDNKAGMTNNQVGMTDTNPLSEQEIALLRSAYDHLISHKDELQVMTIDSYIHSVFRNLICPARGLDRFELDLKAVEKRLPFLFNELMTPRLLMRVHSLLSRKLKPSLDDFKSFFRSLIDNRWIYYLISKRTVNTEENSLAYIFNHQELWESKAESAYTELKDTFGALINNFAECMKVKNNLILTSELINAGFLNKSFISIFTPYPDDFTSLSTNPDYVLKSDRLALRFLKMLSDKSSNYIWNGSKVKGQKSYPDLDNWKELHKKILLHLSDYLMYHLFLPEMAEIIDIWVEVLAHYDKLIYKYKDFTYDDIAWFTFEGLYSAEPPLFEAEKESVANEFYEFLCHRTRFMLIDEFQDTSIIQFQILAPMIEELISGIGTRPFGGLIVVGDEKQSIFGWRGGQRDLLLNLDSIFPNLKNYSRDSLTDSWRSSPTLMNFINNVFGDNELHNYLTEIDSEWKYTNIAGRKADLETDTIIRFRLYNYSSRSLDNKIDKAMRSFITDMVVPEVNGNIRKGRTIAILARKNKELEMIRIMLAEQGITSEYQSSKSLLDHPYIKPVLFLLRFKAYGDWYDFLAFLRSDIVLMNGADLKIVINLIRDYNNHSKPQTDGHSCAGRNLNSTGIDFSSVPAAASALRLIKSLDSNNIYQSCLEIMQTCAIKDKLSLERDFVNIQSFLDLVLDYEHNYQAELSGIQGFLRYCEENRDQDIFKQQDVVNSTAVQLLTIHKSKGLEFDTVFVWWNLKGSSDREDNILSSWVHYSDSNYHNLKDIALSLHYNKVLKTGSFCDIMTADDKSGQLEELNNLYVALTRAKSRLYLFSVYEKKEGWEAYIEAKQKDNKLSPQHYAVIAANNYLKANAFALEDGSYQIGSDLVADIPVLTEPDNAVLKEIIDLKPILPDWQKRAEYIPNDNNSDINMKTSYLVNRDNLKGNIAHYYMSKIKYATREELDTAALLTKRQFGNLMSTTTLSDLISSLESFLSTLKELFDPAYDFIYTEYPIFYNGKEYRIDRLMINTKSKTYRIIDYKTGEVYDENQLSKYNAIVKEKLLPGEYVPEQELIPTKIIL